MSILSKVETFNPWLKLGLTLQAQCHTSEKTKNGRQKKTFSNGSNEHRAENMRILCPQLS